MKFSKLVVVALISSIFFVSCSNDADKPIVAPPVGSYNNGALILNQGGFGHGDASVSYLSNDFATQQNNIFSIVNPAITLGDTGQDIGFYNNLAFIVVNVSNKIEVVNRYTMAHVATISSGFNNPRYIAFANGKGYVTNWGDGSSTTDDFIAVLNLTSYAVSGTIPVAEGPERIVENNNKLYVAHAGGWGFGNTISVVNSSSDTVETTVNVGDVPNSLEVQNGFLYVLCGGKPSYASAETAGKFVKINLSDNTTTAIDFPVAIHPSNLDVVDNSFYYTIGADVYTSILSAATLPTTNLFSVSAQGVYDVYSFAVHDNKIFVADAGDYNSNGKVYVYSAAGALEHDYTVGVVPTGFYFN